jgi:dCMP deaminase
VTPEKARKFIGIAEAVAQLSKDPSTKVGAVALAPSGAILSVGYNGFPRGVEDSPERYADRPTKLALIAHAEQNLVAQAAREGVRLDGCTVVLSGLYPCSSCAKSLIQAGVVRILTPPSEANSKWSDDAKWSRILFHEAGVEVVEVM